MKRVTTKPRQSATRATVGTPRTTPGVTPGTVSSMAQTTEQMAISEPTERSMPPVMITAVMPVAISPVVDT